jgi:hypothetical protein
MEKKLAQSFFRGPEEKKLLKTQKKKSANSYCFAEPSRMEDNKKVRKTRDNEEKR